ncbi:hypothetical protein QQ020_31495 [Fulvivirgaceae bacterium BMA12]|uniref:Uncharacterized protein n=1 Tax=Agaribacillus aureus TaxID=3051825 RepID=A0ABT8LJR2_9BACT|nr:hypothetical protein [Fulvivirgaceae bacterium BMA12]
MAYTDNCDIFGGFHENGFNTIIQHIQHQRPSLFNYATMDLASNHEMLCKEIDFHEAVNRFDNPVVSSTPYLPIPGYDGTSGISYCIQITEAKIDFHPENSIPLPPELHPLGPQKMTLKAKICVGLGCPDRELTDKLSNEGKGRTSNDKKAPESPTTGIPFRRLTCFCLEVYGVINVIRSSDDLKMGLEGLEIVDIKPEGLENILECYVSTVIHLSLLPKLTLALSDLVFELTDLITLAPTPISAAVPFNPAIAQDEVKIMMNLTT